MEYRPVADGNVGTLPELSVMVLGGWQTTYCLHNLPPILGFTGSLMDSEWTHLVVALFTVEARDDDGIIVPTDKGFEFHLEQRTASG